MNFLRRSLLPGTVRGRLMLLVLATLLPSVAISLFAAFSTYRDERSAVTAGALETARALGLVADRELLYRVGILKTLAASRQLRNGDLRAFYDEARAVAPTPEAAIVLSDADGRALFNTRVPFGEPVPPAPELGERSRDARGEPLLVSDLYRSSTTARHSFAVGVPVVRNGVQVGTLSMSSVASQLQGIFEQQALPARWTGSLTDAQGYAVARSINPESVVGRRATPDMVARMATDNEGVHATTTLDGVPVVTVFSRAPMSGWRVLIGLPRDELQRPAVEAMGSTLLASAALLALTLFGAVLMGRTIVRPVRRLSRDAERLRRGEALGESPTGLAETDAVQRLLAQASRDRVEADARLHTQVREAVGAAQRAQEAVVGAQKLEALGTLTGGIAHDFNNLLQTMTTGLALASRRSTEPGVRQALEACERAVSKAVKLTRQLMTFGRAQPGRTEVVDVARQLQGMTELLGGALRASISLSIEIEPGLAPVEVDPVQFELAILNLAVNARDAIADSGAVTIRARNAQFAPDELPGALGGAMVVVSVADTGEGIAPELLEKVFEPFFTTKPMGKGSGLGLAQVYGFARRCGGRATVRSEPGHGTEVSIVMPASAKPMAADAVDPSTHPMQRYAGAVLLVEDEPQVREITAQGLEAAGFTVEAVADPAAGFAVLARGAVFDVVLSDIMMPGGTSGLVFAQQLAAAYPALPVVLASGYAEALQPGLPFPVVAKPYDIDRLARLLAEQIEIAARPST